MTRLLLMLGLFIGSSVGSALPMLWGAGLLSFSSVILGAVGGLLGIAAAFKIIQRLGVEL